MSALSKALDPEKHHSMEGLQSKAEHRYIH